MPAGRSRPKKYFLASKLNHLAISLTETLHPPSHNVLRMLHPNFNRYRLLTRTTVLRAESREFFLKTLDGYYAAFEPGNIWEREIVEDIVVNVWRKTPYPLHRNRPDQL